MNKRFLNLGLLAMVALPVANSYAADKVGIVNMQKALTESKKGKAAKAALEKEVEEKRKKVEADRAEIQKASEEFQKKSAVMSEKARTQKGTELQTKIAAFQELMQKSQAEVQAREAELTKPIIDGIKAVIPDIAKKNKVELAFEENTSGLLFTAEKVDLTDEVIKAYDSSSK